MKGKLVKHVKGSRTHRINQLTHTSIIKKNEKGTNFLNE